MPVYGPNSGTVPFTGYTNTLGTSPLIGATSGSVANNSITQSDDKIAWYLQRPSSRATRRVMLALLGVVPGSSALETRRRRQSIVAGNDPAQLGGLCTIETINIINRVTTAADVTAVTAMLNRVPNPSTYPRDASGNGGFQPFWG